jgi:hypothetical protein
MIETLVIIFRTFESEEGAEADSNLNSQCASRLSIFSPSLFCNVHQNVMIHSKT